LVHYVVGRILAHLPPQIEREDLLSWGVIGLLTAADSFDASRGTKSETYAVAKIKGAILEFLRQEDWVPRSLRAKARALERAHAELEQKLGRQPEMSELAAHLGLNAEEYDHLLAQVSQLTLTSLDSLLCEQEIAGATTPVWGRRAHEETPGQRLEEREMRRILREAIQQLPQREALVMSLYYYEGLTLKEIGAILGVTEARVCQLHTQAIVRLRSRLGSLE